MSILDDVRSLRERVERLEPKVDRHEEQISGKRGLSASLEELMEGVKAVRDEFRASRQGLSRGEKIALFASGTGFLGALAAAYAVLSGGA